MKHFFISSLLERVLYLGVCLLISTNVHAQKIGRIGVNVNDIDTSNHETKRIIDLFDKFYRMSDIDVDSATTVFSSKQNTLVGKSSLSYLVDFQVNNSLLLERYFMPTITDIKKNNDQFIVTISYSHCLGFDFSAVSYIVDVLVKTENETLKIQHPIPYYLKKNNWKTISLKNNKYFWSASVKINKYGMISLNIFSDRLAKKLKIPEIPYNYIVANSKQDIEELEGIRFKTDDFRDAFADHKNNIIFITNGSFSTTHEIVHLYTNTIWPHINTFFDEGLAVHWGNHANKPLSKILPVLKKAIGQYPDIDLGDFKSIRHAIIPNHANVYYTVAGFICKIVEDKQGIVGINKLVSYGNGLDEYSAIEHVLGVKKADLNAFLRKELEKY